jgi:hypothetical protein
MKTWKIEGNAAIRIAERDGVTLHKYADPREVYRKGVSVSEARDIAKEDADLIYCLVQPTGWTGDAAGYNVADYFRGSLNGMARSGTKYLGPDADGVEPTWSDALWSDED